jgi:FAD/FMN-containing dehydrogenase
MNIKKCLLFALVAGLIYLVMLYGYFGTSPRDIYYCPTTMPGQAPISLKDPQFPDHTFQTINDISCMNKTRVYDIVQVETEYDIQQAIETAQEKSLHVSMAGTRGSMGGQAFFKDAVVLDMRNFNKILSLDEDEKTITVQSGATWHEIQTFLQQQNLAIISMQSTDIFTVGGSISVNAHGMDHNAGSIASTIESLSIMLADGTVTVATPTKNSELFHAVIGGYGLFGVILEATLRVTENVMYQRHAYILPPSELPAFFKESIKEKKYGLLYAHLSTSPVSFMKEALIYGYEETSSKETEPHLTQPPLTRMKRYVLNLAKVRPYAQIFKWFIEKHLETSKITSRNQIMHDSVEYLNNIIMNETDLLHEYFVPQKKLLPFLKKIKPLLKQSEFPILNVSIRVVPKEDIMLNYAPEDMYSIVLYINQKLKKLSLTNMEQLTRDLIDAAISFDGTFFLPYQLCYTKRQLKKAYPNIDAFFKLKEKYDPELLFMNNFYNSYAE